MAGRVKDRLADGSGPDVEREESWILFVLAQDIRPKKTMNYES
jgi:hypothetical protein